MNANVMKKMDAVRLNEENEMMLKDKLWNVLENCGFSTTGTVYANTHMAPDDKYYVESSQYTPQVKIGLKQSGSMVRRRASWTQ